MALTGPPALVKEVTVFLILVQTLPFPFLLVVPHGLWDLSSLIRDRIWALEVKMLSPNHWTARKFLNNTIFFPGYPDTGHFNTILNSPLTWVLISNVTIFSVCPFRRFLTSLPLPHSGYQTLMTSFFFNLSLVLGIPVVWSQDLPPSCFQNCAQQLMDLSNSSLPRDWNLKTSVLVFRAFIRGPSLPSSLVSYSFLPLHPTLFFFFFGSCRLS